MEMLFKEHESFILKEKSTNELTSTEEGAAFYLRFVQTTSGVWILSLQGRTASTQ